MFLIRLVANWLCIFTSPIWILPTLICIIVKGVRKEDKEKVEVFVTGKQWLID